MFRMIRFILYMVGILIGVLISFWVFGNYVIHIPVVLPWILIFFVFLMFADMGTMIMQGFSPQVITHIGDKGYWSINRKDIFFIPWYKKTDGIKKQIGEWSIMCVGGIDYWSINPPSRSEYPVLIFPSNYMKKIGLCYDIDVNFQPFKFSQLPPFMRRYLSNKWGRRIKDHTPIYFGVTSSQDGTATPENDALLDKISVTNEYVDKLEKIIEDLLKQEKKQDERKTKNFFIKEAGRLSEGE